MDDNQIAFTKVFQLTISSPDATMYLTRDTIDGHNENAGLISEEADILVKVHGVIM